MANETNARIPGDTAGVLLLDTFLGRARQACAGAARADVLTLAIFYPALVCAYFLPLVWGGRALSSADGDVAYLWLFEREYLGAMLRSLSVPLWNPWMMCGTPFLASSQSGVFYPLNWLYAVLPALFLLNAQTVFHFWLGLAAMHVLVRRIGRSPLAAFVAALVFGSSGFAILHWSNGHLVFVQAWPWTPLALMCWIEIQHGGKRGIIGALLLAGSLAMQLFSGHPQMVYFSLILLVVFETGWLVFVVCHRKETDSLLPRLASSIGLLIAALLAAGLLCAVQAVPTYLHAAETIRSGHAPAFYYEQGSQPLPDMVTAFAPWAFGGRPDGPSYSGTESYWEVTAFLGVTTVCLMAVLFFVPGRMRAIEWTCLILVAVGCWMALGIHGGLYQWSYNVFPGLAMFRIPGRFLYVSTFAAALLAAFSLDRISDLARTRSRELRRCVRGLTILLVAGALAYWVLFYRGANSSVFQAMMRDRTHHEAQEAMTASVLRISFSTFRSAMLTAFLTAIVAVSAIALLWSRSLHNVARLLLASLLTCELALFAWPYRESFAVADIMWPREIKAHLRSTGIRYRVGTGSAQSDLAQGMHFGIPVVFGDEPLVSRRFSESIMVSQGMQASSAIQSIAITQGSPFTDAIGMRYLLLDPRQAHPGARWKRVTQARSWVLYENVTALPRGYTVGQARTTTDPVADVNSIHFDPAATVLLEEPPPALSQGETPTGNQPGDVRVEVDQPERFRALVSMRSTGWFVLMDSLLKGWVAYVDGQPARIFRANSTGRALLLKAGKHEVSMTYRAPGFAAGAWTSGIAWTIWALAWITLWRCRQKATGRWKRQDALNR